MSGETTLRPELQLLRHSALNACAPVAHAFLLRTPGIDVQVGKSAAVQRLTPSYQWAVDQLGFAWEQLQTAEQVHGAEIAIVTESRGGLTALPQVDGLLTQQPGVLLGIMVADCCAVSVVDPVHHAIALLHSGRAGTEGNLTGRAIAAMQSHFQSDPQRLIVQLSPCIRPPHYEEDFPATIRQQARQAGVPAAQIYDEEWCTFRDAERFYSYRREKGKTGRHLAFLGYPAAT